MIRIRVELDRLGRVLRVESAGHAAAGGGGFSLACGIASHALRSFGRVVASGGLPLAGGLDGPGSFRMEVGEIPPESGGWYRGVSDVLIRGLGDLASDFPGQVDLNIQIIEEQETRNGS